MADLSANDQKKQYVEKRGEALGTQFHALWQEIALLNLNWKEYVELFGTNEKRIDRLNKAAPAFFRMLQDELWSSTLVHIARLLDSPRTAGQPNLTIRNFTDLVHDDLKMPIAELIDKAIEAAKFARDWRNRIIAHRDLSLALQDGVAAPLQPASRADVKASLGRLADVMNAVQKHYLNSNTIFDAASRHNGAITLLYLMGDGLKLKSEREERLKRAIESGSEEDMKAISEDEIQDQI
jgi:hypothetical protein